MKALLIGSTAPIKFGYDSAGSEVTLSDFYGATTAQADSVAYKLGTDGVDFSQGFGHVRLSNVFSLDGKFETFLFEDSVQEYSTWEKLYEVTGTTTEVDITLVWNDPPGDSYCGYTYVAGGCVVHDLDLKVYNQGVRVYSNFGAGDGDYAEKEDTYNNAEKVTINTTKLVMGSTIMVVVESNGLSYDSMQNFSVVITGNLGEGSPVMAPTPAPTTIDDRGNCYTAASVVKVLYPGAQSSTETKLTEVKVGDKILSRSLAGEQIYATVQGLPHSASEQPFVHISMASTDTSKSFDIKATPHHTFPACTGSKMVEARKVKAGDCLLTEDGESRVKTTHVLPLNKLTGADKTTYTLVMEDDVSSVSVGGIFTHARNVNGGQTHADIVSHIKSHKVLKNSIKNTNKVLNTQVKDVEETKKHVGFTHPAKMHSLPAAAAKKD